MKNIQKLVFGGGVGLVTAVGLIFFYLSWQNSSKNQEKNDFLNGKNENEQLIGGEKDEHGCLVAAGYSWCESKKKCLRVWEEECDDGLVRIKAKKVVLTSAGMEFAKKLFVWLLVALVSKQKKIAHKIANDKRLKIIFKVSKKHQYFC